MSNKYIKEKEELLEAINILVQGGFKNLKFSRHVEGTIMQVNANNTYDVLIDGEITNNLKAIDNKIYKRGDVVKILIVNNNYSEKYIDFKKP